MIEPNLRLIPIRDFTFEGLSNNKTVNFRCFPPNTARASLQMPRKVKNNKKHSGKIMKYQSEARFEEKFRKFFLGKTKNSIKPWLTKKVNMIRNPSRPSLELFSPTFSCPLKSVKNYNIKRPKTSITAQNRLKSKSNRNSLPLFESSIPEKKTERLEVFIMSPTFDDSNSF